MGVLIIGIVSVTVLVWGLAFCMATESTSEKRRASQTGEALVDRERRSARQEPHQAA